LPIERSGVVTLAGKPVTLIGPEIHVGDLAPDFVAVDNNLHDWRFSEKTAGKVRLISVVPSLDTSVCNLQTRRFDEAVKALGDRVVAVTVSMDLPFAQARWKKEAGAEHVVLVSDHRDASFGQAYGTLIKEVRLDTRAVFVVDSQGRVTYVQYVPEVTTHPDYDRALEALRAAH
jgi:thiol peroxidase